MTIEVSFIHSYCLNGQGGPPQLVVALVFFFFTQRGKPADSSKNFKKLNLPCNVIDNEEDKNRIRPTLIETPDTPYAPK